MTATLAGGGAIRFLEHGCDVAHYVPVAGGIVVLTIRHRYRRDPDGTPHPPPAP